MIRHNVALLELASSDDARNITLYLRWIDEGVEFVLFNGDKSPVGFHKFKEADQSRRPSATIVCT